MLRQQRWAHGAVYGAVVVAVLAGLVGMVQRLRFGHLPAGYGSYVPWGLWVALYVFFVGLSAGAFLVFFLHHGLDIRVLRRVSPIALVAAFLSLAAGLFLIWVDLGHMDRFWKLFSDFTPSSLMAWMTLVYTFYGLVLVLALWALAAGNQLLLRRLSWVGMFLVMVFGGGEGALFGVVSARPYWNSGIIPLRFLFSGLLAGTALVAMLAVAFRRWPDDDEGRRALTLLGRMMLGLLGVTVLTEFADISINLYSAIPATVDAYRLVFFGPYAWVFWIVQASLGLAVPVVLLLYAQRHGSGAAMGVAGALVMLGVLAARLNVIIPGQVVLGFRALPQAFVHPRLASAYFPGAMEWMVAVGVAGAALLVFMLAVERWRVLSAGS